jgi:hypothetical protein
MNTYAPKINTGTHDFIAHITRISFDFSGYEWEEEFESKQEWIDFHPEFAYGTGYGLYDFEHSIKTIDLVPFNLKVLENKQMELTKQFIEICSRSLN